MASYSIETTFGEGSGCHVFAKDYNAIVITDSDAESYGVETTVTITFGSDLRWSGTFNGWIDGKTLTIDLSAVMRALARMDDYFVWEGFVYSISVSGPIEWSSSMRVYNGTGQMPIGGLLPPPKMWFPPAELVELGCNGIATPISPPYGLTFSKWNFPDHDIMLWQIVGLLIITAADDGTPSSYTLSDGSVRICEVLEWGAWHPCEKPLYIQWTGRNGGTKTWVWTLAGASYGSVDGITLTAEENGVRRVSGQEETITIVERAADRDTRVWLADLAEADDACAFVIETIAGEKKMTGRSVYVEDASEVDLGEQLADIEMTVKVKSVRI